MTSGITDEIVQQEILRRRTFAIISHPDAGKTTLTEKVLLYAGAVHLAGAVRARKMPSIGPRSNRPSRVTLSVL